MSKLAESKPEKAPLVLPTTIVQASSQSPKNMIIFSKPKVGKTTLFAGLPNCLIIDLEDGSDYVDALKMKARNISEIKEIGQAIIAAGRPYQFIALDTLTALETMCVPLAEQLYSKSSMGSNWFTKGKLQYGNILNMPNGAG